MVDVEDTAAVANLKARVQAMRAQRDVRPVREDPSGAQLLSLDVGGTVYTASRQTFSCAPESWFSKVLSGDIHLPRTAQDIRFVDRDGQVDAMPVSRATLSVENGAPGWIGDLAPGRIAPMQQLFATGPTVDDLKILKQEARFYRLTDLESNVSTALTAATASSSAAACSPTGANTTGPVPSAAANGVVDDTTDIWNKASRMQLEFQSVYVTISTPNGLIFPESERTSAIAEVNDRTQALQGSGFRVKAMNSGVAQDRRTKDYCMYFHAVLVRNTGRRVPTTGGGSEQAQLPPRSATVDSNVSPVPSTPAHQPAKSRSSRPNGTAIPSSGFKASESDRSGGAERGADRATERGADRQGGALDKLAKAELPSPGFVDGSSLPHPRAATNRLSRERSDDAIRTAGSTAHALGMPSRSESVGGLNRETESFQNLHHSTHGRSAASQAVNTASTIDSMLAAGNIQTQSKDQQDGAGDEDEAHAQAIANLGLPSDAGGRRHAEVRVFDINTDGPPRGIPEDWEDGLLEGRKRPTVARVADDSPGEKAPLAADSHGEIAAKAVTNPRQAAQHAAAQYAAEQSVEQAKKRAARAKLAGAPATSAERHATCDNELFVPSASTDNLSARSDPFSRVQARASASSDDRRRESRDSAATDDLRGTTFEGVPRGGHGPLTNPRDGGGGRNRFLRSSLGRVLNGIKSRGPQSLQPTPSIAQTTPLTRN